MADRTLFVGMDVHRDTVVVAIADSALGQPQFEKVLPTQLPTIRKFFEKLRVESGLPIRACYEASGCGFVLQRAMTSWGFPCEVVAPSLIPQASGDRRKNDKRDAIKLAGLYRGGLLTPVHVPTEEEERVRALTRARLAVRQDIHVSKQQVLKHLHRIGHVYRKGQAWTKGFRTWMAELELHELDREILSVHLALLEQKERYLAHFDAKIEEVAQQEAYLDKVARLRCLRGIDTLTAMSLTSEIGDITRFSSPRKLMGYLGLNVCEDSTGNSEKRGGITKAGNIRCRRLLVEAAWHYRAAPRNGARIRKRREGQPADVVAHAVRAEQRLHKRFTRLLERMRSVKAVTAVARELVGFVWAQLIGTHEALMARDT